jgi:predicted Zn-dependent protease
MRSFFLIFLLCSTIYCSAQVGINQAQMHSENVYALEIQGLAWNRTSLSVMIVTPVNQSWWNPIYLNSTLRAIGQWNEAIEYFAGNYSTYSYLAAVKMRTTVSTVALAGYDIYVNWTETTLAETANEIGLEIWTSQNNAIIISNVSLATHTGHGDTLTDGDMQNIALHELGHSLGLGHSNYTGDTMYPVYVLLSPPRLLSTLDVYGVALVFAWLDNSFSFSPVSNWLSASTIVLPSSIPYKNLPVSSQNAVPQSLVDNPVIQALVLLFNLLIHPDILIAVIVLVAVFLLIVLFPKRKRVAKAHS